MARTAPPARTGGAPWMADFVEELKADPGEWRVVRTFRDHKAASPLRTRLKALGAEAVARNGKSGVDVWARWAR